ncbi:MAG: hypothetical protein H6713_18475 [Myxococcales bacterium]|nr:hypothetical protein [Myxococcales bacterium]MCB9751965.1 hypothetical protein [Myxococcales bacterium]
MARLETCRACSGFVAPQSNVCPHCGAAVETAAARRAKAVFYAASGSLIALTLMACYGGGPYDPPPDTDSETETETDAPTATETGTTAGAETTDTDTDTSESG